MNGTVNTALDEGNICSKEVAEACWDDGDDSPSMTFGTEWNEGDPECCNRGSNGAEKGVHFRGGLVGSC